MSELKAVLWDLDGTIVDSEAFAFKDKIFQIASRRLNLRFDLGYAEFKGKEASAIFATMLARNGGETAENREEQFAAWYEYAVEAILANAGMVELRVGVAAGFKELNDLGLLQAVVTSSRADVAQCYLQTHGLAAYVDLLVARADVVNPKPDPEAYQLAVSRLGVSKDDCIVIEDSSAGIAAARAAGVSVIGWIDKEYQLMAGVQPDFLVTGDSFQEVLHVIHAIRAGE